MVPSHATPGPNGAPEIVRGLLEQLNAILRSAEGVPISSYEELDGAALYPLSADTCAILGSAVQVICAILEHYDGVADQRASLLNLQTEASQSGELCGDVERTMAEDFGVRRVQNLAFIARMGLRARLSALEAMGAVPGKWELIGATSSALREIMKALGAIAVTLCAFEGLPEPSTFYVTELERSLAVRRAYRIFHSDVEPSRDPQPGEIGRRLRRAANAIAKLVGRPIYPSMRVHDRFALRAVQRRLQTWLASTPGDPRSHEAVGLRLFHDLAHHVELMRGVNDRAELRAHDARVASSVATVLESGRVELAAAVESLQVILGRDPELDLMLGGWQPPSKARLVARLRELQLQLAPRAPSVPAPRPAIADLTDDDLI